MKNESIHFIIAGKGAELNAIKEKAKTLELTNISFIGFINKSNLHEMLNITDAIYISFANKPILETNSPNKFFDGLASGKLCICNTRGWIKELIEKNECGFYYNPEKPLDFIDKIIPYTNDMNLLNLSQLNARRLAEREFSKEIMVEKLLTLINNQNL